MVIAAMAAQSVLSDELRKVRQENERLRAALLKAEEADQAHIKCKECGGEGAPEECGECFDLADDARTMRWDALGIIQPMADAPEVDRTPLTECTCGASVDGKWADVHDKRCPAVAHIKSDQQLIDDAWEKHKAAGINPPAPTESAGES